MPKFIAFKMDNGDSFYIETKLHNKKRSIIVDGGDGTKIVQYFKKVVGKDKVDIVVCTHKDSDHAKGIQAFLNTYSCDEVWLPAEWGRLKSHSIMQDGKELAKMIDGFYQLLNDYQNSKVSEHEEEIEIQKESDADFYENISDFIMDNDDLPRESDSEFVHWDHLVDSISQNTFESTKPVFVKLVSDSFGRGNLTEELFDIFKRIISHYENILNIADIALDKGIKIRWYEYSKDAPLIIKKNDPLIPLNSKEILQMRKYRDGKEVFYELLLQFQLSIVNRQSLVFSTRWNNRKTPPVLFNADSGLEANEILKAKFKNGMIITTPHHGSKSNKHAFNHIRNKINSEGITKTNWVRGYGRVTLDSWYITDILKIKGGTRRYCSKCEHRHIQFISRKGQWKQISGKSIRDICTCN